MQSETTSMRIIPLLLLTLGCWPWSGVDAASDKTATGAVTALDPTKCVVMLEDKNAYQFGTRCDFSKLKIGEKIIILWRANGGGREAVQVFVSG